MIQLHIFFNYGISVNSLHGSYSFLNLLIVENLSQISIFYLINWFFAAETIQGRKLFKGGNYMRKYGICNTAKKSFARLKMIQKISDFTFYYRIWVEPLWQSLALFRWQWGPIQERRRFITLSRHYSFCSPALTLISPFLLT